MHWMTCGENVLANVFFVAQKGVIMAKHQILVYVLVTVIYDAKTKNALGNGTTQLQEQSGTHFLLLSD